MEDAIHLLILGRSAPPSTNLQTEEPWQAEYCVCMWRGPVVLKRKLKTTASLGRPGERVPGTDLVTNLRMQVGALVDDNFPEMNAHGQLQRRAIA